VFLLPRAGANRYCIDKNYGACLIIWDKLFGTFEPEDDNDRVVYGLTHPVASYNPWIVQVKAIITKSFCFQSKKNNE
jgi:sterol desaturase/sphingolipid hydroxylase (fatty acid hydroxylase superfamily)